jgi:hypothetical protein
VRPEDGLQWDRITSTDVVGADPDIVKLPDGALRMYTRGCGKDD